MKTVPAEVLARLQKRPEFIRNVCILAHVDHGKTTLADTLVASNGIISQKMAGKLRYMDSLEEEQLRGITMKSSAISLHFSQDSLHYLINLIDSPGHIDFSSEVSTAVRLCDGAVIVVDAVEGVSPQTHAVLRQAWLENIRPVLVVNKIDRLISELKLSPSEAHTHLLQLLEQVNAVMAHLITGDILKKSSEKTATPGTPDSAAESDVYNWDSGVHSDENDDAHLYFSPDVGNVVFGSALDGWGFRVQDFAEIYAKKLGLNEKVLEKTLWGDFYFNSKTKRVHRGAQNAGKKPLFVQMILDNIWAVYNAVLAVPRDAEQVAKVIKALGLKVNPRDLKSTDNRIVAQAIMSQWLPISRATLGMVAAHTPSPLQMSEARVEALMCPHTVRFDSLHERTKALKEKFMTCASDPDSPVIVYVSKMFAVEKEILPENQQTTLSQADLEQRREVARQRQRARERERAENLAENAANQDEAKIITSDTRKEAATEEEKGPDKPEEDSKAKYEFLAFARILSGVIRKGQKLYVLGPKHNPVEAIEMNLADRLSDGSSVVDQLDNDLHMTRFEVDHLYTFMGRELEAMQEIPAGNILGIGGLEDHVLKSATISSDIACPSFSDMQFEAQPIVRVAIEPKHPSDMARLVRGMRLLNHADPCVQVLVQETGEHVLVTAGEVHLNRCCDDLRKRYAGVPIHVSAPIVPFRETIVEPPKTDMVNEAIEGENVIVKPSANSTDSAIIEITKGYGSISIEALPIPDTVARLIDSHDKLLQAFDLQISQTASGLRTKYDPATVFSDQSIQEIATLRTEIEAALAVSPNPEWKTLASRIWSFGPRRHGPNLLINGIADYNRPSVWDPLTRSDMLWDLDSAVVNGFQLATLTGPMCAEPMRGVAFVVRKWTTTAPTAAALSTVTEEEGSGAGSGTESEAGYSSSRFSHQTIGPKSGQVISLVKEACQKAFEAQPRRLMCAMYSCTIQATANVLGKVYGVIGKRSGRVIGEDMQEGTQVFNISALLPVAESFGFSDEIRKRTSGLASPQLQFSHWEVVDVDPYWEPCTEEEQAHFGEKYDSQNRARNYMNQVRKRKGLKTDMKLVTFAEKQRTLSKNK